MAAVSLATLRTRARETADMPGAGFVPDSATGIDAWINEGVQELHEKLVAAYGSNYVAKSSNFTTGAGDVTLPADFFALLGVEVTIGGTIVTLDPLPQGERNRYQTNAGPLWGIASPIPRYQLWGNTLRLRPRPAAGLAGTIEYSPVAPTLVLTTDTVDFPNGWERYVVVYTAIRMKLKQESSVTDLERRLVEMRQQLQDMADMRQAAGPQFAADMDPDARL